MGSGPQQTFERVHQRIGVAVERALYYTLKSVGRADAVVELGRRDDAHIFHARSERLRARLHASTERVAVRARVPPDDDRCRGRLALGHTRERLEELRFRAARHLFGLALPGLRKHGASRIHNLHAVILVGVVRRRDHDAYFQSVSIPAP